MGALPEGRRERKKRATRAKLIDTAASLVGEQGYENTTVQQIADAAAVSPRTVAHYFPSKDELLLAHVRTYVEAVGAELSRVPSALDPLPAILAANVALLDRLQPAGVERIAVLLRSLYVAPEVRPLSNGVRSRAMNEQMAARLRTDPGDRSVELVFAVWAAIMNAAWTGVAELYIAGAVDTDGLPAVLRQRLIDTYHELFTLTD